MHQHVMIMPWVKQDANCGLSCHRMMLETTAEHELPMPPNKVSQGDGGSDEGELSGADRTSPSVPGVLSAWGCKGGVVALAYLFHVRACDCVCPP